jgi:hypothetical protein
VLVIPFYIILMGLSSLVSYQGTRFLGGQRSVVKASVLWLVVPMESDHGPRMKILQFGLSKDKNREQWSPVMK